MNTDLKRAVEHLGQAREALLTALRRSPPVDAILVMQCIERTTQAERCVETLLSALEATKR